MWDVAISMSCDDACPVFPGERYPDWTLDDPGRAEHRAPVGRASPAAALGRGRCWPPDGQVVAGVGLAGGPTRVGLLLRGA